MNHRNSQEIKYHNFGLNATVTSFTHAVHKKQIDSVWNPDKMNLLMTKIWNIEYTFKAM